jgi:hypothetical protein
MIDMNPNRLMDKLEREIELLKPGLPTDAYRKVVCMYLDLRANLENALLLGMLQDYDGSYVWVVPTGIHRYELNSNGTPLKDKPPIEPEWCKVDITQGLLIGEKRVWCIYLPGWLAYLYPPYLD